MAQGGMYDFAQRSEPVVRMAEGGIAGYAAGGTLSREEQLYQQTGSWEAAAALRDQQDRAAAITADAGRLRAAVAPPPAPVDYNALATNLVTTAAANPNITTSDFITGANTAKVGLTQPLATALQNSGLSAAAQYALTHADIGSPLNAEETYGGLKGLSSNINYVAGGLQNLINAGKLTGQGAREQATAEMGKYGINEADIKRATGKTLAELFPDQIKKVVDIFNPPIIPGVNDYGLGGTGTSGALESVYGPSLPPGVSGAGITTVNPNGTITTRPNIPGIPEGGFTGMTSLRDAYEKGGGSLGYVPYTPKTIEEFDTKYGKKLTGGSKQSYDYLTGKTKYSPVPYTETGEIMKPYSESVLGIPMASSKKMYLFDPATKQYKINPDYAIPTYDSKGVKSTNLTNKDVTAYMDKNPSQSDFYTWATTNNLSVDQIAAATGRPISEISKLYTGAKDLVGEDGKIDQAKVDEKTAADEKTNFDATAYLKANPDVQAELDAGKANFGTKEDLAAAAWEHYQRYGKAGGRKYTKKAAAGGLMAMARGGMAQQFNLGDYSDGGRLLRGPGDGVSDSIPASIGNKRPARLADGEFVVPARIVSELGNGSTEAGARKLYAMMDRVQAARKSTVGRGRVAKNSRADKYLPA
jgi:hypothetical protein